MTIEDTDKKIAVGIDLGTHGTGFAWCEISALDRTATDRDIYYFDRWRGQHVSYYKNLSAICLDPSGEVAEWGFEARRLWMDRLQSDSSSGWGYSYAFKMALKADGRRTVSMEAGTVELSNPDTVVDLVAKYLRCVKDVVLAEVGDSGWAMHHIRWCITVPAIWGDVERERVRRAAAGAGLPADDLLIAIEPEATAPHCSVNMVDVLNEDGSRDHLTLRTAGTRFMVIDGGGGTVDLSAHRTDAASSGETRLEDIGVPVGDKLGSEYLNHAFRHEVLAARFGSDTLALIEQECPTGLAELENSWEAKKVTLHATLDEDGVRVSDRVQIPIPGDIWDLLEPQVQDALTAQADGFKFRLVMRSTEVQSLYDDTVVDEILERIETQLAEMRRVTGQSGGERLLLVGGFCRSQYLRLRIRQRFADRDVTVLSPGDPARAVLFGAVRFCANPSLIRSRRSRLTYGFARAEPFEPGKDPDGKMTTDSRGHVLCEGRFQVAVRRGTPVEVNERFNFRIIPIRSGDAKIIVPFYSTMEENPRYVDGCEELAVLTVDLSDSVGQPVEERGVDISMYFGRTTIEVEAIASGTDKRVDADFEFRSMY